METRRSMILIGRFIIMLVTFWIVSLFQLTNPMTASSENVSFAVALVMFVGSIFAVPLICYLLFIDFIAGAFKPPWRMLVYLGLVVVGYAIIAIPFFYGKGRLPLIGLNEVLPFLIVVIIPPLIRLGDRTSS